MANDDCELTLEEIAYHEAGHAIAVLSLQEKLLSFTVGLRLHQVEWRCAGVKCGCAHSRDSHTDNHGMIKIAGSVAESILRRESSVTELEKELSAPYWESARQLARSRCLGEAEQGAYLKWLESRVRAVLARDWQAVSVLADHAIWQVNRGQPVWSVLEHTVLGIVGSRLAAPWEPAG